MTEDNKKTGEDPAYEFDVSEWEAGVFLFLKELISWL